MEPPSNKLIAFKEWLSEIVGEENYNKTFELIIEVVFDEMSKISNPSDTFSLTNFNTNLVLRV